MRRPGFAQVCGIVLLATAVGCSDDADLALDQGLADAGYLDACMDWSGPDLWRDLGSPWHPDIRMATEQVTCTFTGATGVESCRTTYYGPACNGTGSCTLKVSSHHGNKLTWQSSCGGTATTIVDGTDETVAFTCAGIYQVTDKVTCLFTGSTSTQTCSSVKGSCQGVLSCTVAVKGNLDGVLDWTSSCGGRRTTTMDGNDDQVSFSCGQATASETVTCRFKGSSAQHSCAASNLPGYPGCKGTGSCAVKVSGKAGQGIQWKGTCGGYAYTIIDGQDEDAEFTCK